MMHCENVMTPDPVTCRADELVVTAAHRMDVLEVGALPVVDAGGKRLVGILTDRDVARRVRARGLDPWATVVGDVMSKDVVACAPEDDLCEAMVRMEEREVQRLPVVDGAGRLVGILTKDDLTLRVAAYAEFLEEVHAED
jgi:CBS domain-containing protein